MLPTVPRDRRGAVHRRPDPGRLRHRDAGAGHQHAGPHRRAREAGEVQRRDPRRHHARRVHPAHRPGRPARHRHRGPRGRQLDPWRRPAGRRRARVHAHLPAALELPADLQHGRQPRRPGRSRDGPRDPRDLVRPVPGRPGRRRHRPHRAPQRGGARGLRRGDDCHLGDFREYAAIRHSIRDLEKEGVQGPLGVAPRRGRGLARDAAHRRHHPHPRRAARRLGRRRQPAPRRQGRGGGAGGRHRGQAGPPADPASTCPSRSSRHARQVPTQFNPQRPSPDATWRHRCASTCRTGAATAPTGPRGHGRRGRAGQRAARQIRRTRATSAPTARTTPAGPSGGGGCGARPTACSARSTGRTNSVARTFDRICDLLAGLGYLAAGGTAVTDEGERLRRLYTEKDLLAAECLRARRVAPPRRRRARRGRVDARPRAAPRGGRAHPADAERRRRRGATPDGRGSGPSSRTARGGTTLPTHRDAGRRAWRGWCTAGPAGSGSTPCCAAQRHRRR